MSKLVMMLVGVCGLAQVHALPCYITIAKDNCWTNYNVNIDIVDTLSVKVIASMSMPEGTPWVRQEIVCQPGQTVQVKATFSPVFWESDVGKVYFGRRYWSFPQQLDAGESALSMTICYANDFAAIPLPPDASGQCACDINSIPAIKLP